MDLSIKSEIEDKSSISLSNASSPTSLKSSEENEDEEKTSSIENFMPIEKPSIFAKGVGLNQFNETSFPGVSTNTMGKSVENNLSLFAQTMMGGGNRSGNSGYHPIQTSIQNPWNSAFSLMPGYSHHPPYFFSGNSYGTDGNNALLSGSLPKSTVNTFTASGSSTATSTSSSVSVGLSLARTQAQASVSLENDHSNSELFGNRRRQVRHDLISF